MSSSLQGDIVSRAMGQQSVSCVHDKADLGRAHMQKVGELD